MLELDGHDRLVATGAKLFRYAVGDGALTELAVGATGTINTLRTIPGGKVLIGADGGLFVFDPDGRAAAHRLSSEPVLAAIERPDKRLVLVGDGSTAIFDPRMPPDLIEFYPAMPAKRITASGFLPDGSVLVGTEKGLFRLPASSPPQTLAQTEKGIVAIHPLSNGDALVGTDTDLLLYRWDTNQASAIGSTKTGGVSVALRQHEDVVLLGASNGLFLYDARSTIALDRQDPSKELGQVLALLPMTAPGRPSLVLVGAHMGLFTYDPGQGTIMPAADVSATGLVFGLQDLKNGQFLVLAWNGVFLFDTSRKRLFEAGNVSTGDVSEVHILPGGSALVGSERGLFIAPNEPLAKAKVGSSMSGQSLPVLKAPVQVGVTFEHVCAPAITRMSLALVALHEGTEPPREPNTTPPTSMNATLSSPIHFDKPGRWSVQLRQGNMHVGQGSIKIPVVQESPPTPPGIVDFLVRWWPTILAGITALSFAFFVVLLFLSHRSLRAFRLLTDPVWGSWLSPPLFLLKTSPWMQRWILEPWFQEVRRKVQSAYYLDPPVTSDGGETITASELLPRLRHTPKLWLQGRSGMGKSSVFAAWERAYFGSPDCPTLTAAVERYGFILVPLRVRRHAAVTVDPKNPALWVVEAVRQHFADVGLGELDLILVKAILERGHVAVALDGVNEADADLALTTFSGQSGQLGLFRQVRVLATSRTRTGEPWQLWHLPQDVASLRKGLLGLWLGPEKADVLDRRLIAEGLSGEIVSGYDVRLVADLARSDPERALLPADRIALYRVILTRVKDATGEPMRLDALSRLAWELFVQGRRILLVADIAALGHGMLDALTQESVRLVRQTGKSFEFRHDQMRAFLAARWLLEELPSPLAMQKTLTSANAFHWLKENQEELWRFVAAMLGSDGQLELLWRFASEDPDRVRMLDALQKEADRRDVTLVRPSRSERQEEAQTTPAAD